MRVSDIGTYLRVRFVNSQNLEYDIEMISIQILDRGVGVCLTKLKKFYINFSPSYESYLWTNINHIIINRKLIMHIKFSFN